MDKKGILIPFVFPVIIALSAIAFDYNGNIQIRVGLEGIHLSIERNLDRKNPLPNNLCTGIHRVVVLPQCKDN